MMEAEDSRTQTTRAAGQRSVPARFLGRAANGLTRAAHGRGLAERAGQHVPIVIARRSRQPPERASVIRMRVFHELHQDAAGALRMQEADRRAVRTRPRSQRPTTMSVV